MIAASAAAAASDGSVPGCSAMYAATSAADADASASSWNVRDFVARPDRVCSTGAPWRSAAGASSAAAPAAVAATGVGRGCGGFFEAPAPAAAAPFDDAAGRRLAACSCLISRMSTGAVGFGAGAGLLRRRRRAAR